VNDTVKGKACIVDNNVDLAIAKLGGFVDKLLEVIVLEKVAGDSQGLAAASVDRIGGMAGLCTINVGDYDPGVFVGEQSCALGADALAGSRDDGNLPD